MGRGWNCRARWPTSLAGSTLSEGGQQRVRCPRRGLLLGTRGPLAVLAKGDEGPGSPQVALPATSEASTPLASTCREDWALLPGVVLIGGGRRRTKGRLGLDQRAGPDSQAPPALGPAALSLGARPHPLGPSCLRPRLTSLQHPFTPSWKRLPRQGPHGVPDIGRGPSLGDRPSWGSRAEAWLDPRPQEGRASGHPARSQWVITCSPSPSPMTLVPATRPHQADCRASSFPTRLRPGHSRVFME